jgi:hypothetical protein
MAVTPAAAPIPEMMPQARPKAPPPPVTAPGVAANADEDGGFSLWGDDGFTFGDLIDIVNPLHHLPGISTLYHYFTDDDIGFAPDLAGGMLFGGVTGLASSVFNELLKETTGHTLGGHAIAFFLGPRDGADEKLIRVAEFFEPEPTPAPLPAEATLIPRAPTHVAVLRSYRPGAPSGGAAPTGPAPGISVTENAAGTAPSDTAAGAAAGAKDWRLAYAAWRPTAVLRRPPPATAPAPQEIAPREIASREIAAAGQDAVFAQTGFVSPSPIFTAPRPRAVLRRPPPAVAITAAAPPPSASRPASPPGRAVFQPAAFHPPAPPASLKTDGLGKTDRPGKAGEPGPWIARKMMHNLDLYRQASQPPAARRPTLDRHE